MFVRLSEDLLPEGTKRAEELAWRVVGCGVEVSARLAQLGLSAAIVTGIGRTDGDKEALTTLRQRGVQLRGTRSDARGIGIPITVRVRTPRHEVRMITSGLDPAPSTRSVARALPGIRHFHVCGSTIQGRRGLDAAKSGLGRAAASGVSTSLDVTHVQPSATGASLREHVKHVDVLFASSQTLRALAEQSRIGDAAASMLALGVTAVAVRLGAGGTRIYSPKEVTRIPSFGEEVQAAANAFASGYLLGWLLGASSSVSGVLGGAACRSCTRSAKLPDRRELTARLIQARANPVFRKLVPALGEAQRLLEKSRRLPRRDISARRMR
jgi:sugar/nucleoside kinase (ribokinase family)